MYQNLFNTATRYKQPKERNLRVGPFTGGLVTSRPPEMMSINECSEFQNIVFDNNGIPRTRPGLTSVCSGVAGTIDHVADVTVQGSDYTIISSTYTVGETTAYRLYKKNGTSVTQIGDDDSFSGVISFLVFNSLLMIFDGSYVKFWDGTNISLAFDYGIGPGNYFVNNASDITDDVGAVPDYTRYTLAAVYTKTRIGVKFTTPDFGGQTMKPQLFTVRLSRIGDGCTTGHEDDYIKATIREFDSPYTLLASKNVVKPGDVRLNGEELYGTDYDTYQIFSMVFTDAEITSELESETDYLFSIEYTYTDNLNGIYVLETKTANTITYDWNGSSYDAITTAMPCFDVKSCIPPKMKYGVVNSSRIFGIEGPDGDNPTYIWYSGAGDHLDWSSPNYGGYFDTGSSVGGMASFYDDVWIFGTERQPTLRRLTGGVLPINFKLSDAIQYVSGQHNSIISMASDVMFLHTTGISSVNTMQDFGDVRKNDRSANIRNVISASYSEAAFAGYEPSFGVYVVAFEDGGIYAVAGSGQGRYPISKWVFNLPQVSEEDQTITAFGPGEGFMYVGTDKGVVYKMDVDKLVDGTSYPTYKVVSGYIVNPHYDATAIEFFVGITSASGGSAKLKFYRDHSTTSFLEKTITLPTDKSGLNPDSSSTYLENFSRGRLNFNFKALKVGYETITPNGTNPIFFGDIRLITR